MGAGSPPVTERVRPLVCPAPHPSPPRGPAHPHEHVDASPSPISELDLNKKEHIIMITFCPEVCVLGCEKKSKVNTDRREHKERERQPTQDSPVV